MHMCVLKLLVIFLWLAQPRTSSSMCIRPVFVTVRTVSVVVCLLYVYLRDTYVHTYVCMCVHTCALNTPVQVSFPVLLPICSTALMSGGEGQWTSEEHLRLLRCMLSSWNCTTSRSETSLTTHNAWMGRDFTSTRTPLGISTSRGPQ